MNEKMNNLRNSYKFFFFFYVVCMPYKIVTLEI